MKIITIVDVVVWASNWFHTFVREIHNSSYHHIVSFWVILCVYLVCEQRLIDHWREREQKMSEFTDETEIVWIIIYWFIEWPFPHSCRFSSAKVQRYIGSDASATPTWIYAIINFWSIARVNNGLASFSMFYFVLHFDFASNTPLECTNLSANTSLFDVQKQ